VVDGRNFFDPEAVVAAGLSYEGIGRPAPTRRSAAAPSTGLAGVPQYGGQ
jgi:hypothetical protein